MFTVDIHTVVYMILSVVIAIPGSGIPDDFPIPKSRDSATLNPGISGL